MEPSLGNTAGFLSVNFVSWIWSGNLPGVWLFNRGICWHEKPSALWVFQVHFHYFSPLLSPHCAGIRHCCLNYVLFRTGAGTTHSAGATSASWTHRTYCSVPSSPSAVPTALALQLGGQGDDSLGSHWSWKQTLWVLVSSSKVHLHTKVKQLLSVHPFLHSVCINTNTAHESSQTPGVYAMDDHDKNCDFCLWRCVLRRAGVPLMPGWVPNFNIPHSTTGF